MADNLLDTLLNRAGINMPPQPSPDQQAIQDELAKRAQANDPTWKKWSRAGLEGAIEGVRGLVGAGDEGGATHPANKAVQMLMAGIPFSAPLGKVFHGSGRPFDYFNPLLNNPQDTLGVMTHFAEAPDYAEMFTRDYITNAKPNIRPAVLDVKNALDLQLHPKINRPLPKEDIAVLEKTWRRLRNEGKVGELPQYLKASVHGEDLPDFHDTYITLNVLNDYPSLLHEAGFDGVKYTDMEHPAWAVLDPTKAKTPWGLPLAKPGTPIPKGVREMDPLELEEVKSSSLANKQGKVPPGLTMTDSKGAEWEKTPKGSWKKVLINENKSIPTYGSPEMLNSLSPRGLKQMGKEPGVTPTGGKELSNYLKYMSNSELPQPPKAPSLTIEDLLKSVHSPF